MCDGMKSKQLRRAIGGILGVLLAIGSTGVGVAHAQQAPPAPRYPPTHRGAQVDDIHGIHVADPYRWLEEIASADVRSWVSAQNAATEAYLSQVPNRQHIRDRVAEFWNYPKLRSPFVAGDRQFYYENRDVKNQPVLYVQDRVKTPPHVLLDPNALSVDGIIAVAHEASSPDGRYLAYGLTTRGSEWEEVHVRDVNSGRDVADTLRGIRHAAVAWTHDNRGFFYVRSDGDSTARASNPLGPEHAERVLYHRLGERQSNDQVILERPDHPDWLLAVTVSQDGQYAVISAKRGTDQRNRLFFVDLDRPKRPNVRAPVVTLFDMPDAKYDFVASRGSLFYLLTTKEAPRSRVVAVDINAPGSSRWTTVVHETYDALVDARLVGDRMVAHRLHDASSVLELYALDGGPRGDVQLPSAGTVADITNGRNDEDFYFSFSACAVPPTIFRYNLETRTLTSYKDARLETDLSNYETTQRFFTSSDGMRVPMFITARHDLVLDGSHPTLLVGDGAFANSMTPTFSPEVAAWLDMGGVYAVANVRGGGEYGRAWHDEGMLARKQTSFDDFIAAAELLIGQRYTRPSLLAIGGQGSGGLLAAGALVQRPQLFGAALIDGGILDVARFDKFTIGWAWTAEFGSPNDAPQLKYLLGYSPLHNVHDGVRYPAVLVTAGEHDDRVAPVHSYKFAAALQAAGPGGGSPALLRVDHETGNGDGMAIRKQIELAADRIAFLAAVLGVGR